MTRQEPSKPSGHAATALSQQPADDSSQGRTDTDTEGSAVGSVGASPEPPCRRVGRSERQRGHVTDGTADRPFLSTQGHARGAG